MNINQKFKKDNKLRIPNFWYPLYFKIMQSIPALLFITQFSVIEVPFKEITLTKLYINVDSYLN
jgi:hypothetical protein